MHAWLVWLSLKETKHDCSTSQMKKENMTTDTEKSSTGKMQTSRSTTARSKI